MADQRDDPEIFWVEPRERAIIPLDGLKISKSLRKTLRQDRFKVTVNRNFPEVVRHCADPRPGHPESWISRRIEKSYIELHRLGSAHSVECWRDGDLVGGLYGVCFDQVFCGESMFSRADNASKIALCWLVALMRRAGYRLLDCQFMTDHLASLGAIEISQAEYLSRVEQASGQPEKSLPQAYSSVLAEDAGLGASSPGKLIAHSLTQTS